MTRSAPIIGLIWLASSLAACGSPSSGDSASLGSGDNPFEGVPAPTVPKADQPGSSDDTPAANRGSNARPPNGSDPLIEICGDGLDNDNNGTIDCFDPACGASCGAPSCTWFDDCQVARGCDCIVGVDCPVSVSARSACAQSCTEAAGCSQACEASAPSSIIDAAVVHAGCLVSACPAGSAADGTCALNSCTPSWAQCYQTGNTSTCAPTVSCTDACPQGDAACAAACSESLDPDAFVEWHRWSTCTHDYCGDWPDDARSACELLASRVACAPVGPSCVAWGQTAGADSGALLGCLGDCRSGDIARCATSCIDSSSMVAFEFASEPVGCGLDLCFGGLDATCLVDAWLGDCVDAFVAAGGLVPEEVCAGGGDEDADGAFDCDDSDCADAPECNPTAALRIVSFVSTAAPFAIFGETEDTLVAADVDFANAAVGVELPAGAFAWTFAPANFWKKKTNEAMPPLTLEADGRYTLLLHGSPEALEWTLLSGEMDDSYRFAHVAETLSSFDVVSVSTETDVLISDLEYGAVSDWLAPSSESMVFGIDLPGGASPDAAFAADDLLSDPAELVVLASYFGETPSLWLLRDSGLESITLD